MNERGIASLTAMLILLMLAYSIRGTTFTAGNLVDMIKNFEAENQLQLAAESALEQKLAQFKLNEIEGENLLSAEEQTAALADEDGSINEMIYTVKVRHAEGRAYHRTSGSKKFHVTILAVAQKKNYIGTGLGAFRSVGCLLSETEKEIPSAIEGEPPEMKYIYKFEGYLHKTI